MFRPVSVELWLSDKNQVKSCFKPHSRCSPPTSCFNNVSWDKEVLWQEIRTQGWARHYVQVCVCSTFPQGLTCWVWRSWAGVATRGLRLWGQLDVLPNSLKRLWRRLMVEKWTINSRATALVDIPAVGMPIARSLKTCDIFGIVLCNKTAHFRVAFLLWPA